MRWVFVAASFVVLFAVAFSSAPMAQKGKGARKAAPDPIPASTVPTLRIPFSWGGPSLDPHVTSALDPISMRAASLVFDSLYLWHPGEPAHVKPALADGWPEISEDGLMMTIRLRKDVMFHKHTCFGEARTRELNATDVVRSLQRAAANHESGMGWMLDTLIVGLDDYVKAINTGRRGQKAKVDGLAAPDAHTVVIKLTRPCASLPTMLAHPGFSILPVEALDGQIGNIIERTVGTGPYRLNAVAEEHAYVFTRVKEHWGELPGYERIVFAQADNWVSEEGIVSEMENKFIDGTFAELPLFGNTIDRYVKDGKPVETLNPQKAEYLKLDGHGYYFVAFNMDNPIWGAMDDDGRNLRRAVALACDRNEFLAAQGIELDWFGLQDGVLPIGTVFADTADTAGYGKHDLDAAKALVEKTKYKGGKDPATGNRLQLDMLASDGGVNAGVDRMLRKALNSLGMQLTVRNVPDEEYRSISRECDQHAFIAGWFLDYPDPVNFLQLFHSRNAGLQVEFSNNARYRSEEFDQLLDAYEKLAPSAENEAKRRELTAQMTALIAKDQPTIPIMHSKTALLRSGKVAWPNCAVQTFNNLRFAKETAE